MGPPKARFRPFRSTLPCVPGVLFFSAPAAPFPRRFLYESGLDSSRQRPVTLSNFDPAPLLNQTCSSQSPEASVTHPCSRPLQLVHLLVLSGRVPSAPPLRPQTNGLRVFFRGFFLPLFILVKARGTVRPPSLPDGVLPNGLVVHPFVPPFAPGGT